MPAHDASSWYGELLLLEDDSGCSRHNLTPKSRAPRTASLHKIFEGRSEILATEQVAESHCRHQWREELARRLLESYVCHRPRALVVAGTAFGAHSGMLGLLENLRHPFIVELPPSELVTLIGETEQAATAKLIIAARSSEDWQLTKAANPATKKDVAYSVYSAGLARVRGRFVGWLHIIQTGGIQGVHGGTIVAFSSLKIEDVGVLVSSVGWTRWIRPMARKKTRLPGRSAAWLGRGEDTTPSLFEAVEEHDRLSSQDTRAATVPTEECTPAEQARPPISIVELFSGAGGMGLGFLLANDQVGNRYRLRFTAEVHPVYVQTLRDNYKRYREIFPSEADCVALGQVQPVDLTSDTSFELIANALRGLPRLDLVIGGPPCQGFSAANRNSWHSDNPNNQLVDAFLAHVGALQPRAFVMENVEGIMYTAKAGQDEEVSVLDHFAKGMSGFGYLVFPVRVDASDYGVPQYRTRFFIIGLHRDLGLSKGDFTGGKPFPPPTHGPKTDQAAITVDQAIGDLPPVGNGAAAERVSYNEPAVDLIRQNAFLGIMRKGAEPNFITDHITSRHADYVLERYRAIPEGGNWQDIAHMLTNYADADRTHSNIYRRLDRSLPSVTIGNYRKCMLVHPTQCRGLSLREASRLQSFPDWFRFAGCIGGGRGCIGHKQQQLANAVCPLVTRALAVFLADLL